jgi:hypothetical protein
VIGLAAAPRWPLPMLYLAVAALAGFLARQPITLVVKAYSGRRARDVLPAAWFWLALYGSIAVAMLVGLVLHGFGFVLTLAVPGLPVFAWHLVLVARRAERRQQWIEVLAAGALALAAPAALWVGMGRPAPVGWWLWLLACAQSASAIVHAYMRLEQRARGRPLGTGERWALGSAALSWTTGALAVAVALAASGNVPPWVFVAFVPQWLETIHGAARPAVDLKPTAIGWRQLAVSTLATLLFIVAWR